MSNASRGRFRRPLNASGPSGAGPEVSIAVPVSLLDPQVMPRRLRIAPRLIMLAARTRGDPAAPCDVTNRLAAAGRDGAAR